MNTIYSYTFGVCGTSWFGPFNEFILLDNIGREMDLRVPRDLAIWPSPTFYIGAIRNTIYKGDLRNRRNRRYRWIKQTTMVNIAFWGGGMFKTIPGVARECLDTIPVFFFFPKCLDMRHFFLSFY